MNKMKYFISADIEGTCGATAWTETEYGDKPYDYLQSQMIREVSAVCEAINAKRAESEIIVRDSHDSARNLDPMSLPQNAKIIRGWSGDPYKMMTGVDIFRPDGVFYTGYHAPAGTSGNPLAHTMNTRNFIVKLNGDIMSEFMLNTYTAAYFGVPVLFISGDETICSLAKKLVPAITAVPLNKGLGNASISVNPKTALEMIKNGVASALEADYGRCFPNIPDKFTVETTYREHYRALNASYFPGAIKSGEYSVEYSAHDYLDVLRFFLFTL